MADGHDGKEIEEGSGRAAAEVVESVAGDLLDGVEEACAREGSCGGGVVSYILKEGELEGLWWDWGVY